MKLSRRWIVVILGLLAIASVSFWSLASPSPPPEAPIAATPDLPPLPSRNGRLTVPVTIPIQVMEDAANKAMPNRFRPSKTYRFKTLKKVFGFGIYERFVRIRVSGNLTPGRLRVTRDGDRLRVGARVAGPVQAHIYGPNPHINVALRVSGTVRPELRSDWSVTPNLTPSVTLTRPRLPTIELPLLPDVDLSGWIEDKIEDRIESHEDDVQAEMSRYVRRTATQAWQRLCQSILVSPDEDLWLRIEPKTVATSPARMDDRGATLFVGVEVRTLISSDSSQPKCPLPANLDVSDPEAHPIVEVAVPIEMEYSDLGPFLLGQIGSDYNEHFRVDSIAIQPSGESVLLSVSLSGARQLMGIGVKGTVYVTGTPELSADGKSIVLRNVKIDTASSNWLVDKLGEAAETRLRTAIEGRSVASIEQPLGTVRREMESALNTLQSEDVRLEGRIDELRVQRIAVGPEVIRVVVTVMGVISASVGE